MGEMPCFADIRPFDEGSVAIQVRKYAKISHSGGAPEAVSEKCRRCFLQTESPVLVTNSSTFIIETHVHAHISGWVGFCSPSMVVPLRA